MEKAKGVYKTKLKNGTASYRASITYRQKHIALGSFPNEEEASAAYLAADEILHNEDIHPENAGHLPLPYEKSIILLNFRDNGMYFSTPIYLQKKYFQYYLSPERILTFDIDDLFYYASHTIMERGSHLFVADYGSQISILSRFGVPPYAVKGRDYVFANGDEQDFRYENILVLNRYRGVRQFSKKGFMKYKAIIHIKGDFIVGIYDSEAEAAIAYNKAADILKSRGCSKEYTQNYLSGLSASAYAEIYTRVYISPKILSWKPDSAK